MASQLVVLIQWALVLVLVVSGALKIGHSAELLRSFDELRVPRMVRHRGVAVAVPIVEIVVGVALLLAPAPVFTVAALGASALFLVFFALTLGVVARGEQVVCACFGVQSTRPIDSLAVARNALLLAGAVAVTVGSREGAVLRMRGFALADWAMFFGVTTAALAAALTVLLVLRARGAALTAAGAAGRPAAASATPPVTPSAAMAAWPVPDLEVTDAAGRSVELAGVARDRPVLLVLLSAHCTPCAEVADRMPGWRERLGDAVEVAVLTSETPEEFAGRYPQLEHGGRRFHGYRSLMAAAGIQGVPSAVLLGTDRAVAAGPAQGLDEVIGLADAVASVVPAPTRTS